MYSETTTETIHVTNTRITQRTKPQVKTYSYLHIVDYPVDKQLRRSSDDQVLLLAGYKVAVDGKLHRGGGVCLSVHGIHPGKVASASDR